MGSTDVYKRQEVQDQIKDNVYTVQNVSGDVAVSVSFRPPVMDPQHYEYAASLTFDTLYNYYGSPYDIMKNWEPKSSVDTYNNGRVYRNWYTKGQWSWLQYDWDDKIDINYLNVYWSVNDLNTPTSVSYTHLDIPEL